MRRIHNSRRLPLARFERTTCCLGGSRSIQLSYRSLCSALNVAEIAVDINERPTLGRVLALIEFKQFSFQPNRAVLQFYQILGMRNIFAVILFHCAVESVFCGKYIPFFVRPLRAPRASTRVCRADIFWVLQVTAMPWDLLLMSYHQELFLCQIPQVWAAGHFSLKPAMVRICAAGPLVALRSL